MMRAKTLTLLCLFLLVMLCGHAQSARKSASVAPPARVQPAVSSEQRIAQSWLRTLSLRDRVAQLVVGVADGDNYSTRSDQWKKYQHWVRDLHIGGFIINNAIENGLVRNAEPYSMAVFLNQMQKLSRIPLIFASDFERGASMRVSGTNPFPYSMAIGATHDTETAFFEGKMTAREARALGIRWIFAPVADVNNNPENPIINVRSYGEDPEQVSKMVAAFIDGAHSEPANNVLVTAKHFPGHGDTSVDSHMGLANMTASREHMDAVELKPFQTAIAHGVDSIMTAHMTVPAVEPEPIPATVSAKVLTGLLRNELKFKNLIVTDAMDMLGLAKQFNSGEASVRALMAGADVLLMPPDPERAIRAVLGAVEDGRLTRKRIDESALRVLAAKVRVGLNSKKKLVDLEAIADGIDVTESAEMSQQISDHAVTLVKNEGEVLPLKPAKDLCLVALVSRRNTSFGVRLLREFEHRSPGAHALILDGSQPLPVLQASLGDVSKCSTVVLAAFVTATSYSGTVAMAGDLAPFVRSLTESSTPVVFIALGNPYLLNSFQKAASYLATFSTTTQAETSAIKAIFGEIAISGRLPVSIPGIANYGDGIQLPARAR